MKESLRWKVAQRAEIRWWQNYLARKSTDDYLSWKRNYWVDLLDRIGEPVNLNREQHILDIGCGPAGIFMIMDNGQVDAVDPLLDKYEEKLDVFSRSHYPNVHFFTSSIEDFTPRRSYDMVFCLNAINHVANIKTGFSKLGECTKPGGLLVISIDAHNYRLFKLLFRFTPGDILHPHQYDVHEYERMVKLEGFENIKRTRISSGFFFNYYVLVCRKT